MKQKYFLVLKYIAEKWKEPSTKAGITIFFGVIGLTVSPENMNVILSVVGSILSLLLIVMDESERKEKHAKKEKGAGCSGNNDSELQVRTRNNEEKGDIGS